MTRPIVAIDGPAGAGKSTIARLVAERLGYVYIDTGAMYRAVALKTLEAGVPLSEPGRIVALAKTLDIRFENSGPAQRILADGSDVTDAVRSPEATRLSSPVSAIQGVRKRMVGLQRQMGSVGGVVMEGRDIGTVVFPDAQVKVFLTASVTERARRRTEQLGQQGVEADIEQIASEMKERDLRDSSRKHAPLRQAADAVLLDTDSMSVEQVVDAVIAVHDEKVGR